MQVNNVNSNQNFGMAMTIQKNACKLLSKKLNGDAANIGLLNSMVKSQENNPFGIFIRENKGRLEAVISDDTEKLTADKKGILLKQGLFERLFQTPLKFIENCCKYANHLKDEQEVNKTIESIFGGKTFD